MVEPAVSARRARCRHTRGHETHKVPGRALVTLSARTGPNEGIPLVAQSLPTRPDHGDG